MKYFKATSFCALLILSSCGRNENYIVGGGSYSYDGSLIFLLERFEYEKRTPMDHGFPSVTRSRVYPFVISTEHGFPKFVRYCDQIDIPTSASLLDKGIGKEEKILVERSCSIKNIVKLDRSKSRNRWGFLNEDGGTYVDFWIDSSDSKKSKRVKLILPLPN